MPSYSRVNIITLLSVTVPFYGMLIIGLIYPAYFFGFIIAGSVISVGAVSGNTIYGMIHYMTYNNLGTTIQYEDDTDKFEDLSYTGCVPILGPFKQTLTVEGKPDQSKEQTFYCACIKDDQKREWMIFFDHHFGQLNFSPSDVIKEYTIAKIRSSFITTCFLKVFSRARADLEIERPNWWQQRLLGRKIGDTHLNVTALFAYGTTVTSKDIRKKFLSKQPWNISPPCELLIDKAFDHYAKNQLWLVMDENLAKDATIDDLHQMVADESALKIKLGKEEVVEEGGFDWGKLKWVAIAAIAIILVLGLYKVIGLI